MAWLYEVEDTIGEGGMGVVRRAKHRHLGRFVAIKEIKSEAMRDREFRERFDREAKAAGRFYHQNVVCLHDYWIQDSSMSIVMEYVDGVSVRQILAAHRRMSAPLAAFVALEVARGLRYVHRYGLVHRDVKSSNVMVSRSGEVKISDFGIVKVEGEKEDLTRSGTQPGTPQYMSPEQIEGRSDAVDARSDIFSLGVCLYEMLSGVYPFGEGSSTSVAARVLRGRFDSLRKTAPLVPRRLRRIVHRCLRRRPRRRYQTMRALEQALARYLWRFDLEAAPAAVGALVEAATVRSDSTMVRVVETSGVKPAGGLPRSRAFRRARLQLYVLGALVPLGILGYFLLPRLWP